MTLKRNQNTAPFFILPLTKISKDQLNLVGGKALNLGELNRIKGLHVPDGFAITTAAFQLTVCHDPIFKTLTDELSRIKSNDRPGITVLSSKIREFIEQLPVAPAILDEIRAALSAFPDNTPFAVRSSATAEDLPGASFAGQQDTFLNIVGIEEIIRHTSKCWASLFTERAISYRLQNGYDHRQVLLAVVVQQMVFPQAAGIMFTADPVSGNRKIVTIDAGFGLGEAMVSGLVNADNYKVAGNDVVNKTIPLKSKAIYAAQNGGNMEVDLEPEKREGQVLSDPQILTLQQIGRAIENYFGTPQDIEWCLAGDTFHIVQSRPITTLFPVPQVDDQENHVYVSVGHQQMMTDAMKPLGLSFFLLTTPALMRTAGGRLFVDVTPMLGTAAGRNTLLNVLGKSDPIIKGALTQILGRDNFVKRSPEAEAPAGQQQAGKPVPPRDFATLKDYDPVIVQELIRNSESAMAVLAENLENVRGTELFDFIVADLEQRKMSAQESESFNVIMTGMNAAAWLNEKMEEWLGEKNAADVLAQSVSHNITSEMGLDLLNVADTIRPFPEVIQFLQQKPEGDLLAQLTDLHGGREARDAIYTFLEKYGMRCAGEIDITRTRWSERPAILFPLVLSNIRNFEPGEAGRKFEQGKLEAFKKESDLLNRLKDLPDGAQKVKETKRMIGLVRNFSGYREYPKYGIVSRYYLYKQALFKEAEKLVAEGVLAEKEDIYYLSCQELREVVVSKQLDPALISQRKTDFERFEKLSPPRVMTSDGEIITANYDRANIPADAIVGMPVSAGAVEGRARVILNIEDADLEEGDILVTRFTDPSWTPVFVAIKGLVTEVGGLMTHGAVIAREYGLPAVVGIDNVTKLIKNGQRIYVDGTNGYVRTH